MNPGPHQHHARSDVYFALAEALYEPEAGVQQSLYEATSQAAELLGSPACQKAALTLAVLPAADTAELRQRYIRVTRQSDQRPLALYESLHREGRLMGEATRVTAQYYRALGIAPTNGELADHASVELTFLGHLATAEALAAINSTLVGRLRMQERTFLRTHPGAWLPDVGREMANANDPFYTAVGSLLSGFLAEELIGASYRKTKRVRVPALEDTAACNLCGLCIGVCLPRALGIVENENETVLALNIARCVGCNRCLSGCPQGVLSEVEVGAQSPQNGATGVTDICILRRSPRARCPACGCPTVSQAELDAIFAALQPEPAMQRQMSLCVGCKSIWSNCRLPEPRP